MLDRANKKNTRIQLDQEELREIELRLRSQGLLNGPESKLSEGQLDLIYRRAKTTEEVKNDDIARRKRLEGRIPRFISLKISLIATLLFITTALFLRSIETLWYFGQLMGITFSFLIAMIIPMLYVGFYHYLERIFYLKGKSLSRGAWVYFSATTILVGASLLLGAVLRVEWTYFSIFILGGVYLLLMYGLTRAIIR